MEGVNANARESNGFFMRISADDYRAAALERIDMGSLEKRCPVCVGGSPFEKTSKAWSLFKSEGRTA